MDAKFAELDTLDLKSVDKLIRIVELFRTLDHKIPSSQIHAFLAVCAKPGLGPSEYAKLLGTTQPIASRMLLELGQKDRTGTQGMDLVDSKRDIENLRIYKQFLTPKGRRLLNQILRIMKE